MHYKSLVTLAATAAFSFVLGRSQTSQPAPTSAAATGPAASQAALSPAEEAELAIRMVDERRPADAMRAARSAYQRATEPGVELLAMGIALDANGRGYEAMSYLEQYLNQPLGRNDWRGRAAMGSILLRAKSYYLARTHLDEAAKLVPRDNPVAAISVAASRAQVLVALDKREEATRVLREVQPILKDQTDLALWLAYGRILQDVTGYSEDVEAALRQALAIGTQAMARSHPTDIGPVSQLLACYNAAKQVMQAEVTAIDTAEEEGRQTEVARVQRRPAILQSLAVLSLQVTEPERRIRLLECKQFVERAIEYLPQDMNVRLMRAQVLAQLGDRAGTEETLRKILELEPGNAAAQKMLGELRGSAAPSGPAASEPPGPAAGAASQPAGAGS